jgi:hypothetical protein
MVSRRSTFQEVAAEKPVAGRWRVRLHEIIFETYTPAGKYSSFSA